VSIISLLVHKINVKEDLKLRSELLLGTGIVILKGIKLIN